MIVLVHGVPETAELWDQLRPLLHGDTVALSMPGFGSPRPDGFGATKDEYANWLVSELEAISEPVHLVGHDWGASLTTRVAMTRPDLLRSWVADNSSGMHPDYEWHDFAKIWQTAGDGEAFFEATRASDIEPLVTGFTDQGIPEAGARYLARQLQDPVMAGCILALYRSATPNNHATWGADVKRSLVPALVLTAINDPFVNVELARHMAAAYGARVEPLEGLGHWWMLQAPEIAAPILNSFIASAS